MRGQSRLLASRVLARLLLIAACLAAGLHPLHAEIADELGRAIELYQEARYEEALEILEGLDNESNANLAESRQTIAEYKALCLLALGRTADAEQVLTALIGEGMDYRPRAGTLPPRYVALVDRLRNRLLPEFVRSEYRTAKERFDAEDYDEAGLRFKRVVELVEEPSVDPEVRTSLADVRELAAGFLTIISRATERRPLPSEAVMAGATFAPALTEKPFYTAEDIEVTPPGVLRQDIPAWRASFGVLPPGGRRGLLVLMIDRKGLVEDVRLVTSLHPIYDNYLVKKAMEWRYRPAVRHDRPVRYSKVIEIALRD